LSPVSPSLQHFSRKIDIGWNMGVRLYIRVDFGDKVLK